MRKYEREEGKNTYWEAGKNMKKKPRKKNIDA